ELIAEKHAIGPVLRNRELERRIVGRRVKIAADIPLPILRVVGLSDFVLLLDALIVLRHAVNGEGRVALGAELMREAFDPVDLALLGLELEPVGIPRGIKLPGNLAGKGYLRRSSRLAVRLLFKGDRCLGVVEG